MIRLFLSRRVALRLLCACLVLVLTGAGIAVFGGAGAGGGPAAKFVNRDAPEAQRALRAGKAQRDRLRSPQAERQRRGSRTAFRDMDARAALRLGRRTQRAVLVDRAPRPLAAARRHGMAVARYASDYAAVLRPREAADKDEPSVMAMSTLALRSRDDDGQKRLVDLSLRDQGNSWESENPRVKVSIGERVGDGMLISDREIRLVPLDVADQTPGTVSGDAVFFANSATDADHIMRVTPAGAEALVQLRSVDSPQRFRYRIDLPAGGLLREQPDGSISITRNGRRAGAITKPVAWDADQRPIPVNSDLHDGILTLEVAHRGRDVRYPAMVDPNYVDLLQYRWYRGGGNSMTNQYWSYVTNQPSLMGGGFDTAANQYANGLYSISAGAQVFPAGSYGYWRFSAPGTTSVLEAEWTQLSHLAQYAGGPPPCIDYGLIYDTTAWRTHGVECTGFLPGYRMSCWDCNDMDGFDYDPAVKGAQFGTGIYYATIANFQDYLGESTVYLADPDDPTLTLTQTPSTAWTTNASQTIAASASDPGLGV